MFYSYTEFFVICENAVPVFLYAAAHPTGKQLDEIR
jgi:hypothetical protein